MKKTRYFDSRGNEVGEHIACDRNVLRSGFSARTPMRFRDAASGEGTPCTKDGWPGVLRRGADGEMYCDIGRKADAQPQFTDGRTTDPLALQRPGYRIPIVQDRRRVTDALQRYDTQIRNRYKVHDGETQCPDCDGEGEVDGDECDRCGGDGTVSEVEDRSSNGTGRSDNPDPASDSRQVMDQAYQSYDYDLQNAWRKG